MVQKQDAIASARPRTPYEKSGTEIVRSIPTANGGNKRVSVANFSARIVKDLILDDDVEQRRKLCIEAEVGGQKLTFSVSGEEFNRMGWVLRKMGPQAIIYPGQQQHARAAIQWLSGPIRQERIYTHLGWNKQGSDWIYLHAGGAVGSLGVPCRRASGITEGSGTFPDLGAGRSSAADRSCTCELGMLISSTRSDHFFPIGSGVPCCVGKGGFQRVSDRANRDVQDRPCFVMSTALRPGNGGDFPARQFRLDGECVGVVGLLSQRRATGGGRFRIERRTWRWRPPGSGRTSISRSRQSSRSQPDGRKRFARVASPSWVAARHRRRSAQGPKYSCAIARDRS